MKTNKTRLSTTPLPPDARARVAMNAAAHGLSVPEYLTMAALGPAHLPRAWADALEALLRAIDQVEQARHLADPEAVVAALVERADTIILLLEQEGAA